MPDGPKRADASVPTRRLRSQWLNGTDARRPEQVVARFGAMQAQEFEPAKWGIGQRMGSAATDADVERAFTSGEILRTHVMRPTWHFVARDDIRWLLALTAPRVHRIVAGYCRRVGLAQRTLVRSASIFEKALQNGQHLTRTELREQLRREKIVASGVPLAFLTIYAELEAIICSGPRRGRQFTYALVAERAPRARMMARDEALAELCRRFFASHGPATARDFSWWSGLTVTEAKRGLDMIKANREEIGGLVYWTAADGNDVRERRALLHLLPIYDEYFVAYRDRAAVPHITREHASWAGTFQHMLVIAGQAAGIWTPVPAKGSVAVRPLRRLTTHERAELAAAVRRYGEFRGINTLTFRCL